jgi:hypothetical protein
MDNADLSEFAVNMIHMRRDKSEQNEVGFMVT